MDQEMKCDCKHLVSSHAPTFPYPCTLCGCKTFTPEKDKEEDGA